MKKLIIKTNLATEYTLLNDVLSKYAQIIQQRTSTFEDKILTPASTSKILLVLHDSPVLKFFISDLQNIENVEINV